MGLPIGYCLSELSEEMCSLHFFTTMMFISLLCNLIKVALWCELF